MLLIVKLLSIAMMIYGCILVFKPALPKKIISSIKEGNRMYFVSAGKIVVGIILMIAAGDCRISWVPYFWGALSALTGIAVFILKKDVIVHFLEGIEAKPDKFYYYIGGIAMFFGISLALAM